jgi:GTP cyclohydrolase FolE2
MEPTRLPRVPDVQASAPAIPVSLSRVGVTNVEKVTRIGARGAEQLAQQIAVEVRERQDAVRAEVTIATRYPEHKPAPVSGIPTQEIYTLLGSAVASERGTRRLVGVAAQGMTACPCAAAGRRALARAPDRRWLRRRRDRPHLRGRAGCDAQPARPRQENLETIHQHDVAAERFGLLGELRRELDAGRHVAHHTTMREWLDAAG